MTVQLARLGAMERALNRRISKFHFERAGIPMPAFFACVNTDDASKGLLYDSISGARGRLLGNAYFTKCRFPMDDTSIGQYMPVLRCSDESGPLGGAVFSDLPSIGSPSPYVIIRGIVRLRDPVAVQSGSPPSLRYGTVLGREYRNPGGGSTDNAGWQVSLRQALSGSAYTENVFPVLRAAINSGTMLESPTTADTGILWTTSTWTTARNKYFRSFGAMFYQAALGSTIAYRHYNPFAVVAGTDTPVPATPWFGTLSDEGDREMTLGTILDATTSSYYTDTLDGDIVAVGVWLSSYEPYGIPSGNNTNIRYINRYSVMGSMAETLNRLGSCIEQPVSVYIRRDPVEKFTHDSLASTVQQMAAGSYVEKGELRRVGSYQLVRALESGYVGSSSVSYTARRGFMIMVPRQGGGFIAFRDVTGESRESPAQLTLSEVTDGDTVTCMSGSATVYSMARARWRGLPIVFRHDYQYDTTSNLSHTIGSPAVLRGQLKCPSLTFSVDYGRLYAFNLAAVGGFLTIDSKHHMMLFDTALRPTRIWDTRSDSGMSSSNYCIATDRILAFAKFVTQFGEIAGSTGYCVSAGVYGGSLSGTIGVASTTHGGMFIDHVGVRPVVGRFRYEGGHGVAITGRGYMWCGQWGLGEFSFVRMIGGLPGRPYHQLGFSPHDYTVRGNVHAQLDPLWGKKEMLGSSSHRSDYAVLPDGSSTEDTGVFRTATTAARQSQKYSLRVFQGSFLTPDMAMVPTRVSRHVSGGSSLRMYFAHDFTAGFALDMVTLRISYTHATSKKTVTKRLRMASLSYTSQSTGLWTGTIDGAGYFDIQVPSCGAGVVTVDIYRFCYPYGKSGENVYIDPAFEVL